MDEELRESYRTLEKCLFHEGRIVTPSFISKNNILPFFQAVGLEPFLTLNEPICPRFVVEIYHSLEVKRDEELCPYIEFKLGQFTFKLTTSRLSQILKTPYTLETFYTTEWSLNSLNDHPKSNYFGPKHELVKKAITTPRTTQAQLLRDPNKLYIDDIRPDLKRWELFFKENFFCFIDKRNKKVINKRKGPMPFAMLLTCLYNHILTTNPQAIVPISRFTFHEHVMDPLDISRNPSKEKGKKIASPSVISSSSSSFDDIEAPTFLKFYDELSDSEDLTKAQREKRGMFKCLNRYFIQNSPNFKRKTARISVKYPNYVNLTSSSEEQPNERTPSPPPRKKSLSPPQAPSKSISSKSTHYTSSSSPSESPTPTHVAPPPKLRFVILIKLEPQELPPPQMSPNDPYAQTMDNWPPGPSNPSPPPRVSRPPLGFPNPPPGFEPLPSTQPLFVNINNNTPLLHNNAPPLENIHHPPPNLGNQDFPNPPNILDFVHPNDMPHLHNMFCQYNSGCAENQKVKYAASSFINKALTWWNTQVQTRGREAAVGMTWVEFKALLVEEFCPSKEMEKLESKF
ncbi:hypothetical protein Tco_0209521 [Tanacetum coccineum]